MTRLRVAVVRGGSESGRSASRVAASRTGGAIPSASASVAHSGQAGAAASVPANWRVGVDIEPVGAVRPGQLRFFLTKSEREAARELDATALWCLKEAAWKAFGCAPTLPFKAMELVLSRDGSDTRVEAVRIDEAEPVPVQSAVRVVNGSWIVATVAVRVDDVEALTSYDGVASWPTMAGAAHAR